jgi:signal transduction histidine kinase
LSGDPSYSGRFVLLEVSDRGVGMDETTRRRLFEPFFTTKSKGTGLGLPNVRRVVDRAGGLIRVESGPGQGTTFRVFFPRIGASTGGTAEIVLPPEMRDADAS